MPLRALCLSDLHRDLAAARRLGAKALAGGVQLVLSAGDLGVDGTNDAAVYEALGRGGVPVLSVPGTMTATRTMTASWRAWAGPTCMVESWSETAGGSPGSGCGGGMAPPRRRPLRTSKRSSSDSRAFPRGA